MRLLPVGLRHRAFAHELCLRAHCAQGCEWCAEGPTAERSRQGSRRALAGAHAGFDAGVVTVAADGAANVPLALYFTIGPLERARIAAFATDPAVPFPPRRRQQQ